MVGYDNEVEAAMNYVFGSTLLCNDSESAKRVTFANDVHTRSVTLEGDVFDPSGTVVWCCCCCWLFFSLKRASLFVLFVPSLLLLSSSLLFFSFSFFFLLNFFVFFVVFPTGTLTGGSRSQSGTVLTQLTHLNDAKRQYAQHEKQLLQIRKELSELGEASRKYRELKQKYDLKAHEVEIMHQRISVTSHHQVCVDVVVVHLYVFPWWFSFVLTRLISSSQNSWFPRLQNLNLNLKLPQHPLPP